MDILKHKNKIMIGFLIFLIVVCGCIFVPKMNQDTLTQEKDNSTLDTPVPRVKFTNRYIITNDLENPNLDNVIASVSDASEWTAKLVRFEHKGNLDVLDEKALKSLTDSIPLPSLVLEMNTLGTTDIPTEQGIYRAVLEVADAHGNKALEEVYVIYDTTGATINEVADKTVRVEKEDLDKKPEIDKSEYGALDNVDGHIDEELLTYKLELRDEDKHEWLVHVSYTDRAGNKSSDEFLITVKEKSSESKNENTSNSGSNHTQSSDNGNSNAGNTNNNSQNNTENNSTNTDNSSNADNSTSVDKPSNNVDNTNAGYDPMDTNRDGFVSEDEVMGYITPEKQACIDAGYGVVCEFNGGEWYAVLAPNGDDIQYGQLLLDYLEERNLEADNVVGCWINSENNWYWYTATGIHELIGEDDWY